MKFREIIFAVVALAFFAVIPYAAWQLQRRWNYAWSYESMVKETVREMVRKEALK